MTSYTAEHVADYHVTAKMAAEPGWLVGSGDVILDVDEDYFGCESVADWLPTKKTPEKKRSGSTPCCRKTESG